MEILPQLAPIVAITFILGAVIVYLVSSNAIGHKAKGEGFEKIIKDMQDKHDKEKKEMREGFHRERDRLIDGITNRNGA